MTKDALLRTMAGFALAVVLTLALIVSSVGTMEAGGKKKHGGNKGGPDHAETGGPNLFWD